MYTDSIGRRLLTDSTTPGLRPWLNFCPLGQVHKHHVAQRVVLRMDGDAHHSGVSARWIHSWSLENLTVSGELLAKLKPGKCNAVLACFVAARSRDGGGALIRGRLAGTKACRALPWASALPRTMALTRAHRREGGRGRMAMAMGWVDLEQAVGHLANDGLAVGALQFGVFAHGTCQRRPGPRAGVPVAGCRSGPAPVGESSHARTAGAAHPWMAQFSAVLRAGGGVDVVPLPAQAGFRRSENCVRPGQWA